SCREQRVKQFASVEGSAKNVTEDFALWREHNHAARMRVLLRLGVIGVAESDFVRQVGNRVLLPDNAMPAFGCTSPAVAPQVFGFFSSRVCRCIARVDAKIYDLKIASDAHSQVFECLDQTV